jgi:hypothetical protein
MCSYVILAKPCMRTALPYVAQFAPAASTAAAAAAPAAAALPVAGLRLGLTLTDRGTSDDSDGDSGTGLSDAIGGNVTKGSRNNGDRGAAFVLNTLWSDSAYCGLAAGQPACQVTVAAMTACRQDPLSRSARGENEAPHRAQQESVGSLPAPLVRRTGDGDGDAGAGTRT